jgi:carboxyl-terminal processing protease
MEALRSPDQDRAQGNSNGPIVDRREGPIGTVMRPKVRAAIRISLYALLCFIVVGSTFMLGYVTHATHTPLDQEDAAFSVFWQAWDLVQSYFYGDTPSAQEGAYGAIRGSLALLDDPYTTFIEPQQRDREQEELRGSFGGIGAVVERTSDGRIVLTPLEGRPAEVAGVLPGDELIAVDGVPVTSEMSFSDVLALVRGQVGEPVTLTVRREGRTSPLSFVIEREEIVTPSITWEFEPPDIGYIKLSIFNERTNEEFQDAIDELSAQGAEAYIIDLRDNGGGLLTAAIDLASQFLRDGVILYERKSDGQEKPYPVKGRGALLEEPVALLVNGGTASASEIVAGAIQDYERGPLIGTKTFGKASVQLIFDLSDGSSLHVTNAHWLTPSRNEIDGVGLTPNIEVDMTEEDRRNNRDPQRDQAVAYLRELNGVVPAKGNN